MRLNFKQISYMTGGNYLIPPIDASEILTGITWDSRTVFDGALYIALPGEHHDGHAFVESAIRGGARGVLVTETPDSVACIMARELGVGVIEVPNTFHAIEDLAQGWREFIDGKVVAITGSVGKTTTKNLVRDVCASSFSTVATIANQNNELGVPNTLLSANPDTQVVVVEMGMRGQGQIRDLCNLALPDIGLITNIGDAHMELLGSKENICRAKGELFESLPIGVGVAIANADDACIPGLVDRLNLTQQGIAVVWYGTSAKDHTDAPRVWPENVELDKEGRACFTLCLQGFEAEEEQATLFNMEPALQSAECHLAIMGEHNVSNACAAAAVGATLGIPADTIVQALGASASETGRLETLRGRDGFIIINDAYNANPDSTRAALSMLASMEVAGRRIAVLGDMLELGDAEVACHEGIGAYVAEKGIDLLICVGDLGKSIAQGAKEAGMDQASVVQAQGVGDVLEVLEGNLVEGDVVLVKSSHALRLDRVAEGLVS